MNRMKPHVSCDPAELSDRWTSWYDPDLQLRCHRVVDSIAFGKEKKCQFLQFTATVYQEFAYHQLVDLSLSFVVVVAAADVALPQQMFQVSV